jgi:hypothetical protein
MEEVTGISQEIVRAGIAACALLLALGVALGGFESQLGALLGDPTAGRDAGGRVLVLVLALATAASASLIGAAVGDRIGAGTDLAGGMAGVIKLAVDALMLLGALVLALGLAVGGVGGQLASMLGLPRAQSVLLARMVALVVSFAVIAATVPLANTVIDTLVH